MEQPKRSFGGDDEYKRIFQEGYDEVAEHAKGRRDPRIARVLMEKLGYDRADLDIIGADVNQMQGTGNPHAFAAIKAGEVCLDLGSGLGVDAFLAANRVGKDGRVIGLDLSQKEVVRAQKRAGERSIENVLFVHGDMEAIPLEDSSVDVVISNGGFCLVPDKEKAFKEINRVLVPGGRLSISCTTLKKELSEDKDWPSCMEVFMPLDSVNPVLEGIGFLDVQVDDSNSRMDVWDMQEEEIVMRVARDLLPESAVEGMCSHARKAAERKAVAEAQRILEEALGGKEGVVEEEPEEEPVNTEGMCSHAKKAAERKAAERKAAEKKTEQAAQRQPASKGKSAVESNTAEYKGVHWGDPTYAHLQSLDMNSYCARVNIFARKPVGGAAPAPAPAPTTVVLASSTAAFASEQGGSMLGATTLLGAAAVAVLFRRRAISAVRYHK
jgi:SAM-dependent methyltransferase